MSCHRILYSELPHESREDSENHLYLVLGWRLETEGENKLRSIFQTPLHPPTLFLSLTKKLCLKEETSNISPRLFKTEIKLPFLNEALSPLPIPPQPPPTPFFFSQLSKPQDHVSKSCLFTFSNRIPSDFLLTHFLLCDDFKLTFHT